ncbi:MAG: sugar phosphate isomerase/epimerase family protein [Candidatus Latescibacteria bacterium]|jgi:sugar phosphate isomerase/epimerase|nr:sugar phosphate isomerase/epimerase family protein [Candidatus Latescibacterota bacterium]
MGFKYCLNTSTIRNENTSVMDAIDIAADAGYDGIEPWVKEIDEWVDGGGSLSELRDKAAGRNLQIVNLIAFFEWSVPEDDQRSEGLIEARRCFEMADALDCTFVAAPPFGIQNREVELFPVAQRYAELLDAVAGFQAKPLLEFWGIAKTLGTLGETLLVAAECGHSDTLLLADVFHMYKGSGHFHGLEHLGPGKLGLVHVNDFPEHPGRDTVTDADRVYPGDGLAPWSEIVAGLNNAGYEGMLSLELFNPSYWEKGSAAVAEEGLAKLKACVE